MHSFLGALVEKSTFRLLLRCPSLVLWGSFHVSVMEGLIRTQKDPHVTA